MLQDKLENGIGFFGIWNEKHLKIELETLETLENEIGNIGKWNYLKLVSETLENGIIGS